MGWSLAFKEEETIVVNSGSENNHWEVIGLGYLQGGSGRNFKSEAVKGIEQFLAENPNCNKLFGNAVRRASKRANYIDPLNDEKLMNTSLYNLGMRREGRRAIGQDKRDKLKDELGDALVIGNTVYIGSVFLGRDMGSSSNEENRLVYTHETLHVAFRNDSSPHISLNVRLGIRTAQEYNNLLRQMRQRFPGTTKDSLENFAGNGDLDDFLKAGCNPGFKPNLPPSLR